MPHMMTLGCIFGPYLVLQGLWFLFYRDNVAKVLSSAKGCPACQHLITLVSLLLGLAIVGAHNMWMMNLTVLVTLFGWFLLLRGILGLFVPQLIMKIITLKTKNTWGVVVLIWGILMSWQAFWHA